MSYIIKSTSPFVSIKLTETGRQSLALGQLNFAYWAIGDSEINYEREAVVDANQSSPTLSASSRVLRPFDREPNIKSYITNSSGQYLFPIDSSTINVVKAVVNNAATERGFFSGTSVLAYTALTSSTYVEYFASVANTNVSGTTSLYVPLTTNVSVGDFMRLKLTNNTSYPSAVENVKPTPSLWYKVQNTAITSGQLVVTVDRTLPNIVAESTSKSYAFFYKGGEVYSAFGYPTSTAYWDSGTLSFDSSTNITCDDVKVWNMNNVWCENLAGITGLSTTKLYENYQKFGSWDYLGTKNPYFEYLCTSTGASTTFQCNGPGNSYPDDVVKAVSLLHYTNNTISNLYGEFFYIDTANGKNTRVTLPTLMYHKSAYSTGAGTAMGMSFITTGGTNLLGVSDIYYYGLYEDPALIGGKNPNMVGKVFPQLKMVVIEDEEIVAAMSYKGNRNWTLPPLSASLSSPTGGTSTGVLAVGKTIYLTYTLDNVGISTGLTTSLPCQDYIKLTNNSSSAKDVAFKISDVDLLPYMRKKEKVGYDGYGFYAHNFKLLYQIVDDATTRPDAGSWKVYDYTSTLITTTAGQTIDPLLLENQSPSANGFILDVFKNTGATTFDLITPLNMAPNSNPEYLQFGDERFFYGNLGTYIGATIFKTLFDIRINTATYNQTTNPTRSTNPSTNPPNIKVTEVGIYDSSNNLVMIGKLSEPVALIAGQTIMLELSMDF